MSELVHQATDLLHMTRGRMTAQRRLILETLDAMGGHPTAEQIYDAVRKRDRSINPSTVYRTLGWLAEVGLVNSRRLQSERREKRKEQFDPALPAEHHHFVCTHCGKVIEFESLSIEQIKDEFAFEHQARVERASLTLYGLCADCS